MTTHSDDNISVSSNKVRLINATISFFSHSSDSSSDELLMQSVFSDHRLVLYHNMPYE